MDTELNVFTIGSGESCVEPTYSPVSSTASKNMMENVQLEDVHPEVRYCTMETQTDGVSSFNL